MQRSIGQVLNRRGDLSTFLVHLTRRSEEEDEDGAYNNLRAILKAREIEARRDYGCGKGLYVAGESQRVVCFTEAPLEHINTLFDIKGRQVKLERYGLAFGKEVARSKGLCQSGTSIRDPSRQPPLTSSRRKA